MVENKGEEFAQENLQDMLKIYYKRLFPREVFYRWLTYSHSKYNGLILGSFEIVCIRLFLNLNWKYSFCS